MNKYETIPTQVEAWQAPDTLTVADPESPDQSRVVHKGEWLVYEDGKLVETYTENAFNDRFRTPAVKTLPCALNHYPWNNWSTVYPQIGGQGNIGSGPVTVRW